MPFSLVAKGDRRKTTWSAVIWTILLVRPMAVYCTVFFFGSCFFCVNLEDWQSQVWKHWKKKIKKSKKWQVAWDIISSMPNLRRQRKGEREREKTGKQMEEEKTPELPNTWAIFEFYFLFVCVCVHRMCVPFLIMKSSYSYTRIVHTSGWVVLRSAHTLPLAFLFFIIYIGCHCLKCIFFPFDTLPKHICTQWVHTVQRTHTQTRNQHTFHIHMYMYNGYVW